MRTVKAEMEKKYKSNLGFWLNALDMKEYILAKKVGVETATISRYVNGIRLPNVIIAQKIADVLCVRVGELWPLRKEKLSNW